jgi:hypothetical protein
MDQYFSPSIGKWTTAIDWTAAVMGIHVSAALASLSRSLDIQMRHPFFDYWAWGLEEKINKYFG